MNNDMVKVEKNGK